MSRKLIFQFTMMLAMIAFTALPIFAITLVDDKGKDQGRYSASVSGTVSDVTGTTIKILNGAVTVDASAAIIRGEESSLALTLAAIKVGSVVEVSGTPSLGKIVAAVIKVHGPKSDGELSGTITAAANNTITVNGATITLNATTVYKRYHGMILSAANLTVGTVVSVEVVLVQGNLVASEVSLGGHD